MTFKQVRWLAPALLWAMTLPALAGDDAGPFLRSLWLVQRYGTADALSVSNDTKLKGKLAKSLGKDGILTRSGVEGLMDLSTFERLAGNDGKLDGDEIRKALETDRPKAREMLNSQILAHADLLTTSFDMIEERHQISGVKLTDWIVKNYQVGQPLHVVVICTGNSRRSILGATMGNIAASYYGMPEIRFHSGGTAPTAFNPRTITALRSIGVEIEPTGEEATRGESATPNPIYQISWGPKETPSFGLKEFSKTYFDTSNPRSDFAALMVCGEADEGCPLVKGASARISMPYLDPKIYDGSPIEALKYAERRDDIGRLMLSVMMQSRNRLATH